jgi:OOP family OmpA-OmpF porin
MKPTTKLRQLPYGLTAFTVMTALSAGLLAAQPCFAADNTVAEDWADHAWYLGANIGQSRWGIYQPSLVSTLPIHDPAVTSFTKDERGRGVKLFVGKQLARNWALEAGYFDLGKSRFDISFDCGCDFSGEYRMRGINLDLVGLLPLSQRAFVLGRVGATYAETRAHFSDNRLAIGADWRERQYSGKAGIGLEYRLSDAFAVRAEAERYRSASVVGHLRPVDLLSIGLTYKLGRPAAEVASAPAPVIYAPPPVVAVPDAPAPTPTPTPATPVPVPVSHKVSFAAETLFDFDRAVLKPAGKAALDGLLTNLAGIDAEVVIIVGHTDSIGTDAYNEQLSLRRAAAVKGYLVAQQVDASRIYAEGKGESQPVADNRTAAGRAHNRRVTLEVVGTLKNSQ